jgi:hypothetical protein
MFCSCSSFLVAAFGNHEHAITVTVQKTRARLALRKALMPARSRSSAYSWLRCIVVNSGTFTGPLTVESPPGSASQPGKLTGWPRPLGIEVSSAVDLPV